MLWLVQDFALLSVVLRALLLTLQTLTVGGIVYLAVVRPAAQQIVARCRVWIGRYAGALAVAGVLYVATDSAILMASAGLGLRQLAGANYFLAGSAAVALAGGIAWAARRAAAEKTLPLLAVLLMADSVFTSHAVSRLDHRFLLSILTLLHQAAAAAWLGGLAFFLLSLRSLALAQPLALLRRFTVVAVTGVVTLAVTGTLLSVYYVASAQALYGTAYGVMVFAKAVMLLVLVAIGAANFRHGRGRALGAATLPLLRRMSELELIAAFSVLLMAASLTSQPPGVDLVEGRLTLPDLAQHFKPRAPVLRHPPLESLAPATPSEEAARNPDDLERAAAHTNRDPDLAWSEFEHNWAGLFLLTIGTLGTLSAFPRLAIGRVARFWPLVFIVMAVFLMIFSDPENWPLGPVGYWQSFSDPEVLLHRVALSLLIIFGVFETGVQTGRLGRRAAMVFPIMAIAAASGFLLHSHSLGNVRLELLTEISHTPISLLGIMAGAFRLLEIWLRADREQLDAGSAPLLARTIRFASIAWPLCLFAAGIVLVNYREG